MNKYLITGGAGFIGSHLVDRLLSDGHAVTVLDDMSTGSPANLAQNQNNTALTVVNGSVGDDALVGKLVAQADVVYHLAASVGVKNVVDNLVASIENNVQGTEVILRQASTHSKRILLASTSEVYGRHHDDAFSEDDDLRMGPTIKARWSYACSKALDEYLGFAYYLEQDLPVTVVRLFNTVGERQTAEHGMVLPTFVQQAINREPLTIYGDGQQSRCFCHVSDVVEGLVGLMDEDASIGEVYNIGNTEEITILSLAQEVIRVLDSSSTISYIPYQEAYKVGFDDINRRVPNIQKINTLLGWEPTVELPTIINRVAEEYRQQIAISG